MHLVDIIFGLMVLMFLIASTLSIIKSSTTMSVTVSKNKGTKGKKKKKGRRNVRRK